MHVPVSTSNSHLIRQTETEYTAPTRKQPAEAHSVSSPFEKPHLQTATIAHILPLIRWLLEQLQSPASSIYGICEM